MTREQMRCEMDRLAGEILRRGAETDVCLALYERRETLRAALAHA